MVGWIAWVLAATFGAPDARADEIRALHDRIAREAMRGRYLRGAQSSVERDLVRTELQIADRVAASESLAREREAAETRRAEAEQRLEAVRAELDVLRGAAGRRAAAMRRLTRLGPEAFWLGIEDPVRARRTEDRLRFVLEHDASLARRIREALKQERAEVRALEAEVRRIDVARARLAAEASELTRLEAERRVLLDALREERRRSDRISSLLQQARRDGDRAARFVGGRNAPLPPAPGGFEAQRGLLSWPTPGRVEVTFGAKVHPAGVIVRQSGIDLRAPLDAPVRAPFEGVVRYADRRPGWGRLIVLEHPGGWFTVYAHLSEYAVRPGESVRRGQRIGAVGESDSTKGPFLYFEIRDGARAVDPFPWLAR